MELNETHDPVRRSFVPAANASDADFPLQNLPFGVVLRGGEPRCAVAVGDQVLDLRAAREAGLLDGHGHGDALLAPVLNPLMALGQPSALRARLFALLAEDGPDRAAVATALVPASSVTPILPATVGAFTDFFTSIHHTIRGRQLSGVEPHVPPAFRTLPIAYNSRASSVRVSGEGVCRPWGQRSAEGVSTAFGPSTALDFELELGAWVGGPGNALGEPVHIDRAANSLWGFCLLNDWSSRDVQAWESNPLGPFLCKSFSTTVSSWVVTEEALRPFRVPAAARTAEDPPLLPYLHSARDQATGGIALRMEAWLRTATMVEAARITLTDFRHVHWTMAQMAVHGTSNGCNYRPGDLLGSGTVSGPTDESRACLAELTSRGTNRLTLPGGEQRAWLEDGDEVVFKARAERAGFVSIGFGTCRGMVLPSTSWPKHG